jgi:hypothetical protein
MGQKIRLEDTARFKEKPGKNKSLEESIDDFFSDQKPVFKATESQNEKIELGKILKTTVLNIGRRVKNIVGVAYTKLVAPVLKGVVRKLGPIWTGALVFGLVFVLVGYFLVSRASNADTEVTDTLGASNEGSVAQDGRIDTLPEFNLLYPGNKDASSLVNVTRKSPDGTVIHTYKDTLESIEIEVTQQALPESFKSSIDTELEKLAKSFQATSIIQIDDSKIYHGLNDKTGVQSLILVKNDLLIFINSSKKLSDDVWAGYVLGLR